MRVLAFPAAYLTEVVQTIEGLRTHIRADMAMSGEDSPWPNGIIPKDAREGTIYVVVAELPDDADMKLFPMVESPEHTRIAS